MRRRSSAVLSIPLVLITAGLLLLAYLLTAQSVYTRKTEYYLTGAAIRDIPYCQDGQRLDIMQPRQQRYERSPYVVYLHGGGWRINNKSSEPDHLAKLDPLRDEGFAVVSIDYRLITDGEYYPAPVVDTMCALRYLKANADRYNLDADRSAVYGFSAGGYLAGMAATVSADDKRYHNGLYDGVDSRVAAAIILAGLIDFDDNLYDRNYVNNDIFLNGQPKQGAHPAANLSADDPAIMLLHGKLDLNVPYAQSVGFFEKMQRAGVAGNIILVENGEHSLGDSGGLATPSRAQTAIEMRKFIKEQLLD